MSSNALSFPHILRFIRDHPEAEYDEATLRELQLVLVLEHARIEDYVVHRGKPTE